MIKLKAVCDMFGENTVWNLLNIHGWFATILGWSVFILGNIYFLFIDFSVIGLLILNTVGARSAMWTCDFLLKVHIYKKSSSKE